MEGGYTLSRIMKQERGSYWGLVAILTRIVRKSLTERLERWEGDLANNVKSQSRNNLSWLQRNEQGDNYTRGGQISNRRVS